MKPSPGLSLLPLTEAGDRRQAFGVQKNKAARDDIDPAIKKAAEGLESLFLDTMFRTMRNTVQKSELSLDNSATEIYRGMLDSEVAKSSAKNNSGIGLADQIVAYLESRGYNTKSTQGRTGGTNESKSTASQQHFIGKT